jgi:hypothetical protein
MALVTIFILPAALAASVLASSGQNALFAPDQDVRVSERVHSACGNATAEELKPLAEGPRAAALRCFVRVTANEANALLPKEIEPGVVVESVRLEEELLLVLTLQLGPKQARDLAANEAAFESRFANRSCQERPLVRVIDAGGAVVYLFQDSKGVTLSTSAVTECRPAQ